MNIREVKETVYRVGLPAGAVIALLLRYFENAQGTLHIVDSVGLPLTSALLLGAWLCFQGRWGRFVVLETLLFSGLSLMILASLSYSALQVGEHDLLNLTGLSYWTPVLYALAFLIFGRTSGLNLSLIIYALLLGVWGAEVLSAGNTAYECSILFQLFASNALLLLLLYGFGVLVNVQAREKAQYAHAANTDALTGLPNRRLLWSRLERSSSRSSRYGSTFSVALLDLDYFKDI